MNKIKSISKRTIALVLSMLMLLSSGIVGTLAANVELAPTGYTLNCKFVYDNSLTKWSSIQLFVGHSGYSRGYMMTQIPNTNLYQVSISGWGDATQIAIFTESSAWGGENNNISHRFNYTSKPKSSVMNLSGNMGDGVQLIKPSSGSSGCTLSTSYYSDYNGLNTNQTASVYAKALGSTSYSANSAAGTVSVSSNRVNSSWGSTATSGNPALAARTATVTMTAEAKDGYKFVGWYSSTSATTAATTSTTLTYTCTGSATTYYARFDEEVTEVTATFKNYDGTTLGTDTVSPGETPTYTGATPTRTGYTFTGWSPAVGAITENTTYTAQYTANTYTITYNNYDDTLLGKGSAKYDTNVNVFNNAPSNPTRPSTETTDYTFATWVYEDGTPVGADDLIKGDLTLKASYTESTRSYTVNFSNPEGGTVAVTANGASIADGGSVEYGTVLTLTATPDKFYTVGTWTANGAAVDGTTYTVTGDVTLTHTFASKTTHLVRINQSGGSGDINATYDASLYDVEDLGVTNNGNIYTHTFEVEQGANLNITVTATSGYYISRADGDNYGYDHTQITYNVENVSDQINKNVFYTALPTYNVTVSANDSTMGTVTGANDAVIYGNMVNLTATANEGYRFVNWVVSGTYSNVGFADTLAVTSLVPQSDLTITANFAANEGTVNVSATEGGTVDKNGTHTLTYPETITATATATETGYQFTHWTINSTGTKDTDYAVTEQGNEITVQILTDGTEVSVIANFADSRKIKVYTYSDNGFTSLKITESNGTETLTPYNSGQDPITFGQKTWYTPGEVTLTAGYYDEITAQMYGSNPLENGTGNLVIFNNTVGWSNVYLYTSTTTMWNPELGGTTQDCTTRGLTAVQMQRIGSSNYYYAYVDSNITFTLFLETENNNYDRVHNNKASYRGDYSSSKPMFTPNTTASSAASNETNNTTYYNNGSWAVAPTVPTTTNAVDITSALYNGAEWLGKEEVWLYFAANGTTVVATDRKELNGYVTSALIKSTYNNGKNDKGYTDTSWSAFTSAYTAAVNTLGTGSSTQTQIDDAYTALDTAYNALALTTTVTITGSHGAMPDFGTYFGTISFPDLTVTSETGNIGDSGSNGESPSCTYLEATVNRNQVITINTTVTDSDYMVLGWVVNGTEFISATQDIDNSDLFVGTYTCSSNAVIVPIYFRDDTITKFNEGSKDIIKLYAKADDSSTTWGNYMAAYTWYTSSYRQFGRWTGQLMIPDTANPGMYYTYVEKVNPTNSTEAVKGITFNNYGNNTGIYTGDRYQAYDYYEFVSLAEQGYDNIVFELNESDGVSNWPSKSTIDLNNNVYNFYPFVDFSGNEIDISRTILTDEQKALDPALYIVRTGPCDADDSEVGKPTGSVIDGEYFINCYIYNASTGAYIGSCKSYELLDLEALKNGSRKLDLTSYIGKPVAVDYASLTDTSGNKRYDGEWYGTKYGLTNVTISAEVAYLNNDGTVTYYYGQNEVEGVGNAYFNGEHTQEVPHGSENHVISARVADGNDFVGWYLAKKSADGTTYTIDTTAAPLIVELSTTIDASADMIYVAVFKEHPEGTFTVNNYYYTYTDFSGQTVSPYAPPVFGNDTTYSTRDVKIRKIYDKYSNSNVDITAGFAGTYTQSIDKISVGDVLEITIKTKPTFSRDYVYAWYIQANDSYGVNFEEIGTNVIEDNYAPGVEKEFTFTYTVKEGTSSLTIYSDVVHITPEVTLTYIYNNRYNQEQRYVVKYTLTTNDELSNYKPDINKIREYAPYVDDLYKKVNWVIEDDNDISVAGTSYNVRAVEEGTFTVNLIANGSPAAESITVPFNTPIDIYAKDINEDCTDRGGVWFLDKEGDGKYDEGTDKLLNYGNYFGLVVTDDMTVVYTDNQELIYQIILGDPIYGREQSTDANGGNAIDTIYVDYILSYMIPHFTGDKIDVNGTANTSDDVTLNDDVNYNTPVQIKTLEEAGLEVDYGVVLEMVNTQGPADKRNDYYDTYYDVDAISDATKAKLDAILRNKADGADASGKGVEDGSTLATFLYVYASENATNKNRVLKTFAFDNTPANQMKYYNVYGYLKITDKNNNVEIIYSNPQTLNILDESIENVAQN